MYDSQGVVVDKGNNITAVGTERELRLILASRISQNGYLVGSLLFFCQENTLVLLEIIAYDHTTDDIYFVQRTNR